jgi:hypothetical protein
LVAGRARAGGQALAGIAATRAAVAVGGARFGDLVTPGEPVERLAVRPEPTVTTRTVAMTATSDHKVDEQQATEFLHAVAHCTEHAIKLVLNPLKLRVIST